MSQPLRILHLEDDSADAMLVRDLIASEGMAAEILTVDKRVDFIRALDEKKWDVVLADYRLPGFNGLDALKIVREKFPALPFILTSASLDETTAIESLKAGATDYILKQNRERLPSALRRAVAEAAERDAREMAETDLRRSEKQYRLLFQGNPHPMWVFDLENQKILEVNETAIEFYGFSREEFLQMTLTDLRAPGDPSEKKITSDATDLVWTHRRKNGRTVDMKVTWTPLAFRGRLAALTMATDVTDQRRAAHHDAVFGKLSHHLSAVTTATEAAAFICESADELFHWSDFALDLYLAEKDEVVSLLTITTVENRRVEIPPSPQPKLANALVQRVIARGAEIISARETGENSDATMIAPIRKGAQVIGVLFIQSGGAHNYFARDLETLQTLADLCGGALQRVRVEEELRRSQRRFRELFANSPDAIFVEDLHANILDANQSASELHGINLPELLGKNAIENLVPAGRRKTAREDFQKLISGEISLFESESLRADGRLIPVEIRVVRIEYDDQPALLFHVRDISTRHAAEMVLRSSEALFRSVWENSVDGMRLTDENGIMVAVNNAFCRLVNLPMEKLENQPMAVIYDDATAEQRLGDYREYFHAGKVRAKQIHELELHNGNKVIYEISDSYVKSDGQRRLLLTLFRDLTTHKKLEDQLRQSQKMEAIGQLAGGIAHDFNNILTIILGHASLLTLTALEPKAMASARQIKQASERAAGLTRQLLAFGRKQIFNPRPLDLNSVVGGMSEMLERLLGEDISLQLELSDKPALIEADPSMMEQIILNLAVNARDAMLNGGRLAIQVSHCQIDEAHSHKSLEASPGHYVCLRHTDTGVGIPSENLSRIFEPFFTTKELGKGTGLGLATVYGIVKQHRGWIEVESQLGHGTTFNIFLPVTHSPPVEAEIFDTQFRSLGGTETILVVEDERDLREIVTRTLNRHGYRAFQAVDGHDALKIWHEYKSEISLVFTDLVMPGGINGRELAEKLWAERPTLKIIFSSGYGADILGKNFKLDTALNYLQKPYLPQTLARAVRRCLDGKTI
jgi:PAS domain S-box-containing protein